MGLIEQILKAQEEWIEAGRELRVVSISPSLQEAFESEFIRDASLTPDVFRAEAVTRISTEFGDTAIRWEDSVPDGGIYFGDIGS